MKPLDPIRLGKAVRALLAGGTFHDETYKFVQHVCLMEKRIYVLTYANLEEHSESAAEAVKGMVESFVVEK